MIARACRNETRQGEQRQRLQVRRRPVADILRAAGADAAIAARVTGRRDERSRRLLAVGKSRDPVPKIERRLAALAGRDGGLGRGHGRCRAIDHRRRRVVARAVIRPRLRRRVVRIVDGHGAPGTIAACRPPGTGDARGRHGRRDQRQSRDHRDGEGENESEQGGRVLEVLQKAPESYSTPGVPASRRQDPVVGHCELGRTTTSKKWCGSLVQQSEAAEYFQVAAARGDE